jgi:CHAD domain-containing protein
MNRRIPRVTSRLLARRAAALKRHISGGVDGDAHGVHQARVASRRLREALPVLTSGVKGTKAGKARGKIRRLTRALGAVRELDVTLHVLDDLTARDSLPRQALEEVRAHVVVERDERRTVMLKRISQVNLAKLDRRLEAVAEALAESDSEAWRDALGSRLMKRGKALTSAIGTAGRMYSPEHLHAVRIAAKKLRYAMELALDAGVTAAAKPLAIVKRTQNTLGHLHDLQVLQTHVSAVQAAPKARTLPDGGLEIIGRELESQCRHLHARYVASISKLHDALEMTRSVVVPQLAHRARARGRALKMTLKDRVLSKQTPARALPAAVGEER